MKLGKVMTFVIVAAVMLLGYTAVQGQSSSAAPTAIAVVDMQRVFTSLKAQADYEAERQLRTQSIQAEVRQREEAINQLRSDLEMLTSGTEQYSKQQSELERSVIDLQVYVRYEEQVIQREDRIQIEKLYRDVISDTERIAIELGYDMVLLDQELDALDAANMQQLLAGIGTRKVLYASDRVDLTDTVIRRMNNAFDASR